MCKRKEKVLENYFRNEKIKIRELLLNRQKKSQEKNEDKIYLN